MNMRRICTLFGVSLTFVHDAVYAWANLLCVCLPKFYSAYKHNSTLKWLAACCPIGAVPDKFIGRGHGGSMSDSIAINISKMLHIAPMFWKLRSTRIFLLKTKVPCLELAVFVPWKWLTGKQSSWPRMPLLRRRLANQELQLNKKWSNERSYIYFDKTILVCQLALAGAICI